LLSVQFSTGRIWLTPNFNTHGFSYLWDQRGNPNHGALATGATDERKSAEIG